MSNENEGNLTRPVTEGAILVKRLQILRNW